MDEDPKTNDEDGEHWRGVTERRGEDGAVSALAHQMQIFRDAVGAQDTFFPLYRGSVVLVTNPYRLLNKR